MISYGVGPGSRQREIPPAENVQAPRSGDPYSTLANTSAILVCTNIATPP